MIMIMMFRYGGRATSDQCPAAVILMTVQSIVGVIIEVRWRLDTNF